MKRIRLVTLLLLLLAVGCQPSAPAEAPPSVRLLPAPHQLPAPAPAPASDTLHVVAEQVVGQLFKALAYEKMRPLLKNYTKSVALTPSADDDRQVDSTVTYSAGANSFVYLQSGGAAALLRCQVTALPGPLTASIRLGMSRTALGKAVAHPFSADVLRISEAEGYQKFYFVLKNNALQAVNFESDYLD